MVLVERQPESGQRWKQTLRSLRPFTSVATSVPDMVAAFQSEIEAHLDSLYRQAVRLTKNSQTAEDLVIKTYVRAFHFYQVTNLRWIPSSKWTLGSKAWLHRLMQHEYDLHSEPDTFLLRSVSPLLRSVSQAAPRTLALEELTVEAIEEAVAALPVPMCRMVALTLLEELTCRDAALVSGIPEARGRQLLADGRLRLLSLLNIGIGSI